MEGKGPSGAPRGELITVQRWAGRGTIPAWRGRQRRGRWTPGPTWWPPPAPPSSAEAAPRPIPTERRSPPSGLAGGGSRILVAQRAAVSGLSSCVRACVRWPPPTGRTGSQSAGTPAAAPGLVGFSNSGGRSRRVAWLSLCSWAWALRWAARANVRRNSACWCLIFFSPLISM